MELLIFLWVFICLSLIVGFVLFMLYADADLTLLFYHSLNRPRDFRNKVVWITGATGGVGRNLAYVLIKSGAKLALSAVKIERLNAVRKRCKKISKCAAEDILLVPFKINKFEDHDEYVKKVLDHFRQIDILVNNAGIAQRADFVNVHVSLDQHLFDINVFGAVNLTRKVLKHFLERKKGHVVVTTSTAEVYDFPSSCTNTAYKYALHGYFECLRSEMVEENINVTQVTPGPMFSVLDESSDTENEEPMVKQMTRERCSDLIATAIAYQLDECWINIEPIPFIYYVAKYIPTIFITLLGKFLFNKKRIMKMRHVR